MSVLGWPHCWLPQRFVANLAEDDRDLTIALALFTQSYLRFSDNNADDTVQALRHRDESVAGAMQIMTGHSQGFPATQSVQRKWTCKVQS